LYGKGGPKGNPNGPFMNAEAGRVVKLAAIIKTLVTKTPIIANALLFVSFL
jgi:hypothetical protein